MAARIICHPIIRSKAICGSHSRLPGYIQFAAPLQQNNIFMEDSQREADSSQANNDNDQSLARGMSATDNPLPP